MQEAAEQPPVEPEVAGQPVAPTTGIWSSFAARKKHQRKEQREMAVRRKQKGYRKAGKEVSESKEVALP